MLHGREEASEILSRLTKTLHGASVNTLSLGSDTDKGKIIWRLQYDCSLHVQQT